MLGWFSNSVPPKGRGGVMRKRKAVRFVEEMDGQNSPVLAVLKHYGSPLTREEYLTVSYLGEVDPDEEIPDDVEERFPEQFRRVTLVETPPCRRKSSRLRPLR